MDHLHHLRRDRGCGPWGGYTVPGSPANPALSRSTPGPAGVQDATQAFIAAAAMVVVDPLAAAMEAARALATARIRFAGQLAECLEDLVQTDFALSMPSLVSVEALPRSGELPGWFPREAWETLVRSVRDWESALRGVDASDHGDGGQMPWFAEAVARVYAVGGRAQTAGIDFSDILPTLPPPRLVEAFRARAMNGASRALLSAARDFREVRATMTARALVQALAYFDTLSPEWRPSRPERYREIEPRVEALRSDAPDLHVTVNSGGVLVFPREAR